MPENILIGEGKLLKLTHYDEVVSGGSPVNDIAMVGKLMAGVKGKYIKRYQDIIVKCKGQYKSIEELKDNFLPLTRKTTPVLPLVSIFILMALVMFLRRVF